MWELAIVVSLFWGSIKWAYASKEELLDLEEEKSDIEDRIEERRARGEGYDDLEERRNDVQDEIDNVKDAGWYTLANVVSSNVSLLIKFQYICCCRIYKKQ